MAARGNRWWNKDGKLVGGQRTQEHSEVRSAEHEGNQLTCRPEPYSTATVNEPRAHRHAVAWWRQSKAPPQDTRCSDASAAAGDVDRVGGARDHSRTLVHEAGVRSGHEGEEAAVESESQVTRSASYSQGGEW